jgi:hypothetical protein
LVEIFGRDISSAMVMFEAFDNFRVEAISKSLAALPHPDPCFQIPGAFDNERWLGRDGLHGPNVERAKPQLPQGRDCAFLLTAGSPEDERGGARWQPVPAFWNRQEHFRCG